ncbi:hypothetical protein CK203_027619 [Vitis vinifera]|uniref:Reverse transcriptase domain-containing protein n=1 Tax=Vitis vinifera TaxID=29760 RepID=A0A438IGV8_VITVI|nr:hypothetical protein CK203_027619 [Vitis vinifera]
MGPLRRNFLKTEIKESVAEGGGIEILDFSIRWLMLIEGGIRWLELKLMEVTRLEEPFLEEVLGALLGFSKDKALGSWEFVKDEGFKARKPLLALFICDCNEDIELPPKESSEWRFIISLLDDLFILATYVVEAILGLKINLDKNKLIPVGRLDNVEDLALELGFKVGSLPSSYLGMLLGDQFKFVAAWDGVEKRFRKRLAMRRGGALEQKPHLVRWTTICLDKRKEGLGVKFLSTLNKGFGKQLGRIETLSGVDFPLWWVMGEG